MIIYKYKLRPTFDTSETTLDVPCLNQPEMVHAETVGGEIFIWLKIPTPLAEDAQISYRIFATGEEWRNSEYQYERTVRQGPFVWHICRKVGRPPAFMR